MSDKAITQLPSGDRANWMRAIEAAVRRILGNGITTLVGALTVKDTTFHVAKSTDTTKTATLDASGLTASRTYTLPDATDTLAVLALAQTFTNKSEALLTNPHTGASALPGSPVAGQVAYRTDKKCWYHYDGSNWNVVGVEQSGVVSGAPVQTINTNSATDITGASVSVTTAGAGVITLVGWARAKATTGEISLGANLNGSAQAQQPFTAQTSDDTLAVVSRVAVSAAGTYTVKLTSQMLASSTSGTVVSFEFLWQVIGA